MLFRAVFWIGLVAVLMPHEPDVGYGNPSPATALTSNISTWAQSHIPGVPAAKPAVIQLQTRTLAQVKAEIAAARHPS